MESIKFIPAEQGRFRAWSASDINMMEVFHPRDVIVWALMGDTLTPICVAGPARNAVTVIEDTHIGEFTFGNLRGSTPSDLFDAQQDAGYRM